MANVMRWRYGDTHPITVAVNSSTVVEIGDAVYLDTDDAKPTSDPNLWSTDLATTQEAMHDGFLGIAMQASAAGDTEEIRVATTGVFEFAAASDSYQHGQLVGMGKDTGDNLLSQQVEDVATANLSIGRVARAAGAGSTSVLVAIVGTVTHGGPQAAA